jgi:hypothetical protein
MFAGAPKVLLIFAAFLMCAANCYAQTAADNTPMNRPGDFDKDDRPQGIRDTLEKLRIEKEKKEFDRMIERGEQAAKIAAELEVALTNNGRLTEKEKAKLASVEKLAKQIRSDLGGDDEDDSADKEERPSLSIAEAVKSLRSTTENLFKELKRSTRFTISATAIYSSNAVLRLARFMRVAQ